MLQLIWVVIDDLALYFVNPWEIIELFGQHLPLDQCPCVCLRLCACQINRWMQHIKEKKRSEFGSMLRGKKNWHWLFLCRADAHLPSPSKSTHRSDRCRPRSARQTLLQSTFKNYLYCLCPCVDPNDPSRPRVNLGSQILLLCSIMHYGYPHFNSCKHS